MLDNNIGAKLKQLRKQRNMTLEQVASLVGVGKSTVRKWETGQIANMKRDKIPVLAEALGTTALFLLGVDADPSTKKISNLDSHNCHTIKIPMLGDIACGKPIFADQDNESFIITSSNIKADFCLRARGDSMIGARIRNGDIVFIRKQDSVNNGDIAVVIIGDDVTLKRWHYNADEHILRLFPENPTYETLTFVGEELENIHCLGKAVAFQSLL